MTTVVPGAGLISNRERLAIAARAVEPLLNRIVFTGRQVAPLLATAPVAPRPSFASDTVLRALSTASLDRIATDLRKLGLRSVGRSAISETWWASSALTLEVACVSGDESDPRMIWLEYASLLTMAADAGNGLQARITGAPALLALDWSAFAASGESPLDSGEVEDIVFLVSSRPELVREVGAAPPELRTFVAAQTRVFLQYGDATHVVRAAVPGADRLPALATMTAERLEALALLG